MLTPAENTTKTGEYVTRSDQVPSIHPWSTTLAYHLFLSTSAAIYKVTGQMSVLLKRNRVQFLCLHHVFQDEEDPFANFFGRQAVTIILAQLRLDWYLKRDSSPVLPWKEDATYLNPSIILIFVSGVRQS